MSGIPETRKLWITPLSPVHMGTDEDYTPTGYVIEGNALYEFDQAALENLPISQRQSLDKILSGKATPDMLKKVQAFFHKNREWLIPAAVNVVYVSDELARLYEDRVGKAANIETGGKQVLNALEIERAAYNLQTRRLFLPGTGLKGAMRTALLDAINNNRPLEKIEYFDKRENRDKIRKENNKEVQQRLFRYTMRDLHKDPMRLVQVGDCAWHGADELNSAEILFAVNRKKQLVQKDGVEVQPMAEKGPPQMLECATPFRFRAFQGLLNIADLAGFYDRDNKLPCFRFSFGEIATACNRFYRPIFERETALQKNRGYLDTEWRETVERLLEDPGISRRLDSNDAFLLRVGRHSGAESVTINGVRSIKIMKGKGQRHAWKPEAKTVWMATGSRHDKRYLRPFGWLLVEMTEPEKEPPIWREATELLAVHSEKMCEWLSNVRSYQHDLSFKVDRAKELEMARKEKRKRELREEEDKALRYAALSDEEKQICDLKDLLEKDRAAGNKHPGSPLNEARLRLLEEALTWEDSSLRKRAAEVIRETVIFLPWAIRRKTEMGEKLVWLESG